MSKRYTSNELLQIIKDYHIKYGKIPSSIDINRCKPPTANAFANRFGSWNKAVELAGFNAFSQDARMSCKCEQCGNIFSRVKFQYDNNKHHFCSLSCAATYRNTHKMKGYRRSKMEIYIEESLKSNYPTLHILFNDKTTINSELDIYIPSLNLAFELNGIFHYEPIYSNKQFGQIQNNDKRKFQACLEKNIELCIIDTSALHYFKPTKAEKYYQIVKQIIDSKL